jgi:hypothetical protein
LHQLGKQVELLEMAWDWPDGVFMADGFDERIETLFMSDAAELQS